MEVVWRTRVLCMITLVFETFEKALDLLKEVTYLRTHGARQIISPRKHDVYAPRGKLRKCSQHSDS